VKSPKWKNVNRKSGYGQEFIRLPGRWSVKKFGTAFTTITEYLDRKLGIANLFIGFETKMSLRKQYQWKSLRAQPIIPRIERTSD
jgi:hypothetical protein